MDRTSPPDLLISAPLQRSGTTWLQRYFTAAGDFFIWGENHFLIEGFRLVHERWPDRDLSHYRMDEAAKDPDQVSRNYFPNLSPPKDAVLEAMREAVLGMYPDPSTMGRTRWGWKEVRYGKEEIEFFRLLFPETRIILVARNPYDTVRSIRRMGWIDRDKYFTVDYLAKIWAERTRYYLEAAREDPERNLFVRYEDVYTELDRLDTFAELKERAPGAMEVFEQKIGAASVDEPFDLTAEDIEFIGNFGGELAGELGYKAPGQS